MLRESKRELRKQIAASRQALFQVDKKRAIEGVLENLGSLSVYREARNIGLYAADENELPTQPILDEAVHDGKRVAFPSVSEDRLVFRWVNSWASLKPGYRGILEPQFGPVVDASQLDLLLVPGVAFDPRGSRLGRGGGFYDRLLASAFRPRLVVGIAYDFQLLNDVPVGPHDQRVDFIVTERKTVRA